MSERGEASGAALARELIQCWRSLPAEDRAAFHRFIAEGFAPDPTRLRAAAQAYLEKPSADTAAQLADAADPLRQELLRRMNMAPGGTTALVQMREEVIARLRKEPELKPLDSDLRHLFASWFNRGFLELRRIDWRTPAEVLEKLIQYEAVHEIHGWDDLRRRVARDRRMFGFFHPALPNEPLIFVEVALVRGLAAAVQPLLTAEISAAEQVHKADTAIFYSISNCQIGLRGVSFGNFLIKQVVEELQAELPHLRQFATLSPIPGFGQWLQQRLETADAAANGNPSVPLRSVLAQDRWWEDGAKANAVREPLTRTAAEYLTPLMAPRGRAIPWRDFISETARDWSASTGWGIRHRAEFRNHTGLMVNYLYDPATIEANHEAFVKEGTVVRSPEVDALLTTVASTPRRGRRREG